LIVHRPSLNKITFSLVETETDLVFVVRFRELEIVFDQTHGEQNKETGYKHLRPIAVVSVANYLPVSTPTLLCFCETHEALAGAALGVHPAHFNLVSDPEAVFSGSRTLPFI